MVKPWRKRRQAALVALLFLGVAAVAASQRPVTAPRPAAQPAATRSASAPVAPAVDLAAAQDVVAKTCVGCHSDRARAGNLSLQTFDIHTAADHADVTEKMIRKLRAGHDAAAGARRPEDSVLRRPGRRARSAGGSQTPRRAGAGAAHVPAAESRRVRAVGSRSARRSTSTPATICRSIRRARTSTTSPTRRLLSPTLMQAYLTAAAEISRLAVGDRGGDGARSDLPGVALGVAARAGRRRAVRHARRPRRSTHTFPADGEYGSACRSTTRRRARCTATAAPRCTPRSARAGRDLGRRRARGAARHRPLDEHVRSRRREPPHRSDSRSRPGRTGSRRVHPPDRRSGAGSDLAARVVDGEHEHRRRLRLHHAAASARPGDHRPVRRQRRVRHAEPAPHLHLPADDADRRKRVLRARDRRRAWRRRRSAGRRPSAISTR